MRSFIRIIVCCLLVNNVCAENLVINTNTTFDCSTEKIYDTIVVKRDAVFQTGACNVTATKIIVYGTLQSGSGRISCDTLIINGVLNLTDRNGVIAISGDVEINGSLINNTANAKLEISGNLLCNSTFENIVDGNFKLLGENKGLYGNIRALSLEVVGSYTNYGTVEIRNSTSGKIPAFFGSGTFTQAKDALLITRAPSTPQLVASAEGNTVRFERNGNITINCAEFYNVEFTTTYNLTKNFPTFSLAQNTIINGSLKFTRQCFLNLNGKSLIFPQWTENSLLQESLEIGGIILNNGAIEIERIEQNQTAHIPLYHSTDFSDFAHMSFTNKEMEYTDFSIRPLQNSIFTDSEILDELPYIPVMYNIASPSTNSMLSFYWHNQKESEGFDPSNCRVAFFNNGIWEAFDVPTQANSTAHPNIYFITTNYANNNNFTFGITSDNFLPVSLTHFSVTKQNSYNELTWKTASEHNCDYFLLLKSLDGLNFFPCARIAGNGTSSFSHKYSFCDKEQIQSVTYYQLAQYDYDGLVWKSNIISAPAYENSTTATLVRKSNTQCVVQTVNDEYCFVSDRNGRIVDTFASNMLYDFSHLTSGIYFVNVGRFKILDNCLIVR
ncbi:MAG: hypothetical protein FWC39_03205 [Bacteroidetes bacterium]|nr:hypothetical protein [Bacteroidota bacterium]